MCSPRICAITSPRIRTVTINTTNNGELAAFWSAFLDREVQEHDDGASIIRLEPSNDGGVNLGFQQVTSRLEATETHLDIVVEDLDAAQDKIETHGGSIVKVNRLASGFEWRIGSDPHGNAFCIFAE